MHDTYFTYRVQISFAIVDRERKARKVLFLDATKNQDCRGVMMRNLFKATYLPTCYYKRGTLLGVFQRQFPILTGQ